MVENPPRGLPRILSRLAYEDVNGAVAFLERAFGFEEHEEARIEGADGTLEITEMDVEDSRIMLGRSGVHGMASPRRVGASTQILVVYIDDLDAHFERAREAGAEVVSEPEDQFWGDRRYEVRDLEGHHWSFHQHVRDVSREEMAEALRALREG